MSEDFILITGRTNKQGMGLHKGKGSETYRMATNLVEMSSEDMARLAIVKGQVIRLMTSAGQVEVPVQSGKLPPGMVFIPMGPAANTLIQTETGGTGMPAFKGVKVRMEFT